jgi:predicted GNAT superfamily acetyltransferase
MGTITIEAVSGLDALAEVQAMQRQVFGYSELEVLPVAAMRAQVEVGALVLAARDEGKMVAFLYSYPGTAGGRTILHSDLLGVLATHRDRGLGYRMKIAQREWAAERGFHSITWTFDPRKGRNAHLNFHKLGARSRRYLRDYYGEGADRLWVEWPLAEGRLERQCDGGLMVPIDGALREALEGGFARGCIAVDFLDGCYVLTPPEAVP